MELFLNILFLVGFALFIIGLVTCLIEVIKSKTRSYAITPSLMMMVGLGFVLPSAKDASNPLPHSVVIFSIIAILLFALAIYLGVRDLRKNRVLRLTINGGKEDTLQRIKEFLKTQPQITTILTNQEITNLVTINVDEKADEKVVEQIKEIFEKWKISKDKSEPDKELK